MFELTVAELMAMKDRYEAAMRVIDKMQTTMRDADHKPAWGPSLTQGEISDLNTLLLCLINDYPSLYNFTAGRIITDDPAPGNGAH